VDFYSVQAARLNETGRFCGLRCDGKSREQVFQLCRLDPRTLSCQGRASLHLTAGKHSKGQTKTPSNAGGCALMIHCFWLPVTPTQWDGWGDLLNIFQVTTRQRVAAADSTPAKLLHAVQVYTHADTLARSCDTSKYNHTHVGPLCKSNSFIHPFASSSTLYNLYLSILGW
jgi:hypothetical protein